MLILVCYINLTLQICMEHDTIQMASTGSFIWLNPFRVILDNFFVHLGLYLGNNLTDVGSQVFQILGVIDIYTIFDVTPQEEIQQCQIAWSWMPVDKIAKLLVLEICRT